MPVTYLSIMAFGSEAWGRLSSSSEKFVESSFMHSSDISERRLSFLTMDFSPSRSPLRRDVICHDRAWMVCLASSRFHTDHLGGFSGVEVSVGKRAFSASVRGRTEAVYSSVSHAGVVCCPSLVMVSGVCE